MLNLNYFINKKMRKSVVHHRHQHIILIYPNYITSKLATSYIIILYRKKKGLRHALQSWE